MKKWILSAAFIMAISGYAAAQGTPLKTAPKKEEAKAVKKGLEAKEGLLYLGVWYRLKESLIPTINLQWRTMNIGLSYDSFAGGKMARPRSFELSISTRIEKYRDYRTGCFAF